MKKEPKNCAFQYYDGIAAIEDKAGISISEAKELFNFHLPDMVERTKNGGEIKVALWINMRNNSDYSETLIHICEPEVDKYGNLWEKKIYVKL